MNLVQLQYLVSVASTCNMHQSAEELHVSESSLSQAIKALEEEYGTKLFRREGRKLILLPVGAYAAEEANRILTDIHRMKSSIHSFQKTVTENISVAFEIPGVAKKIFNGFRSTYPNIFLEPTYKTWASNQTLLQVAPNRDFYLSYRPFPSNDYRSFPLPQFPMYLLMSQRHPLASKSSVFLSELKDEVFLMPPLGAQVRSIFENFLNLANINPRFIVEGDSLQHALLLMGGNCVEFLTEMNYLSTYDTPELRKNLEFAFIPIKDSYCHMGAFLCYDTNKVLSSGQTFFLEYCEFFFKYLAANHSLPPECKNISQFQEDSKYNTEYGILTKYNASF